MDKDAKAYSWDRLVRAAARGPLMTEAQRADLADFIISQPDCDKALLEAADALRAGELDEKKAASAYKRHAKGFDPAAYRERLAPPPDESAALDERIRAIIGGER